ncbi:MAG: methionine synthase [Chloroflexi bacterium]|nr:MAG: methionine synthase [Chloroflexota bacterium]
MSKELVNAIADMEEKQALDLASELLAKKTDPMLILDDCRSAMEIVGQRYEAGTYFLPELLLAGEMLTEITAIVKPEMAKGQQIQRHGKVLIGTVKGDIHDIGKNIVTFMLDASGFEVKDLGVDVPAEKFVEAIREFQPQVVGLSGFLTLAFDAMKDTIGAIQAAGLRDGIKIMVGGGPVSEEVRNYTGADAYGKDAMAGVTLARQWVGVK